jgi:hypothetical protein
MRLWSRVVVTDPLLRATAAPDDFGSPEQPGVDHVRSGVDR